MWHHSPFMENIKMNLDKYGHKFDEEENLVPAVITGPSTPVSCSIPCTYSKCCYANFSILCKRIQMAFYGYRKC